VRAVSAKEPVSERVNSNVQLTCTITDHDGWTNYSVTWYKDGHLLSDGRKYEMNETSSGTVLTVRRVKEYDVGLYQCAVTLGTGRARRTLKHVVNLFCTYYVYRVGQKTAHCVFGNNFVNSQSFFIIFGTHTL